MCTQSRCHKISPRTIEYRSYKSFDTEAFNQDLASVPWHVVENENNIDDAVLTWKKLFSEIADAQAPLKKRRLKGVAVPWMNDKIRVAMRDRDYHHRKAVKSNSSYHWEMYRKLRNSVNKSKYYLTIMNETEYLMKNYGNRGGCYP